jgi:Tfp pilus assembly protein PilX
MRGVMRNLVRDEAGVALPVAIMVMVIVGVMGAGLLVFVRNDLEAVVEVNRGQKAMEIAEAGVAAAKRQLVSDNVRRHYDTDSSNDCTGGQRVGEDWSPATTGSNADCSNTSVSKPNGPGVRKNFAGGRFVVTIQCYEQGDANCAGGEASPGPETPAERRYFKITSTGYFPASGSGAVRTVQAIYYTEPLNYPTAYYTPSNINFNGNTDVSGVGFFAKGNITGVFSGSFDVDRSVPALYGDWNTTLFDPPSNFNTVSRRDDAGVPLQGAGFAAEGLVCGNPCSGSVANGYNDYDSTSGTRGQNLKFDRKVVGSENDPNPAGLITYPFEPPPALNDWLPLEIWEEDARAQGTYKTPAEISNKIENTNWPTPQSSRNVFFVEAGGQTIDINYRVNLTPIAEGVIVVRNGNVNISNSSNGFKGIIVVTGNGTTTGNYKNTGGTTITGFVIADGTMTLGGDVSPTVAVGDFESTPGYHRASRWSWRECYSINCS